MEIILLLVLIVFVIVIFLVPFAGWQSWKKQKAQIKQDKIDGVIKPKPQSMWTVDKEEMIEQVGQYHKLKPYQSYRGISSLIISIGLVASLLLQLSMEVPLAEVLITAFIAALLIYFIYIGHRWAMVVFILSFSANLILSSFQRMIDGTFSMSTLFIVGGVWILVTSFLVKAIKVENERKKTSQVNVHEEVPEQKVRDIPPAVSARAPQIAKGTNINIKMTVLAIAIGVLGVGFVLYSQGEDKQAQLEWQCLQEIEYRPTANAYYRIGSDRFKTQDEAMDFCLRKAEFGG